MSNLLRMLEGGDRGALIVTLLVMLAAALVSVAPELVAAWNWLRATWSRMVGRQG